MVFFIYKTNVCVIFVIAIKDLHAYFGKHKIHINDHEVISI